MEDKEIQKEYIVIVTKDGDARSFQQLINCDSYDIEQYVKRLAFGSDIRIQFFSISKLNDTDTMDLGDAGECIVFNNGKSFNTFISELNAIFKKLEIASEQEAE